MKVKKIIFIIAVVLVLAMFTFLGCKQTTTETAATGETTAATTAAAETTVTETTAAKTGAPIDILTVAIEGDMATLDQMSDPGGSGLYTKQLLYNGLVEEDAAGNVIPGIAETWTISDDGKEYTFNLRKGVKFHNGRELKAEDVKFSIERMEKPETASIFVMNFSHIEKIDIIDDYTIKFTLDMPYSPFLIGIATGFVPIAAKESYDADNKLVNPIGTGPYKYVEWIPDDHFTVAAFEDYWNGAPTVKQIVFKVIPDPSVRLIALKTGEVDIIPNPPLLDLVAEMEKPSSPDFKLDKINAYPGQVAIALNIEKTPFDKLEVRQALSMLIDSQEIIDTVFNGVGVVCEGPYGEGTPWYVKLPRPEINIEKAKALLAQAGYADGFEFGLSTVEWASMDKVAEVIQAQLAKANIKVNVELDEFAVYADRQAKGDFDSQIVGGDQGTVPDPDQNYSLLLRTGNSYPAWFGNYSNPEIDKLLDQGIATTDLATRQELYKQVAEIIMRDVPVIWLYQTPILFGYRTDLIGIENAFAARMTYFFDKNKGIGWLTR